MATNRLVGTQLGNYEVGEAIGQGGTGVVFAARHRFLGEAVAIKVLHPLLDCDPVIGERFFREARSARAIAHPSVVRVLDFGHGPDGEPYLVMERLDGKSFAELITAGPLAERD